MKRKALATQFNYSSNGPQHHCGPVARLERRDKCSFIISNKVDVERSNMIELQKQAREVRLKAFNFAPILRKKT